MLCPNLKPIPDPDPNLYPYLTPTELPQILASIGQLEFFYDQAPDVMRSCSMALQLLSVAIGSYLAGALVYIVGAYTQGVAGAKHGWLPSDLNKGRVDLFFLLLGGEFLFSRKGHLSQWLTRGRALATPLPLSQTPHDAQCK